MEMHNTTGQLNDGPFPPDGFSFDGKVGRIKRASAWKLVSFLWSRRNRRASFDSLAEPVWGNSGHDISYMAISSIKKAANRFFRENEFPFMVRMKSEEVFLIDQRMEPERKG